MSDKSSYWASVARHHIASRKLYHVDMVILVEDVDDILFWQLCLKHVKPEKKVKFNAYSINEKGLRETGKKHCLKYVPFLCNTLAICIDSDFDYLLDKQSVYNHPFVFQTYTYSWENHFCFAPALQTRWKKLCPEYSFDFDSFISCLNTLLYTPLLQYLLLCIHKGKGFSLDELCSSVLKVHFNKASLSDNGARLLLDIGSSVDELLKQYVDNKDFVSLNENFCKKGFSEQTAYLYMQGHCVYDLINRIGKFLLNGTGMDFENQVLKSEICFDSYAQIIALQKDLSSF